MQELSYQSSLELNEATHAMLKHIPTASEVTLHARQHLVTRLDLYQREHAPTFAAVIAVVEHEFLPAIRRHALVGEARVVTRDGGIFEHPLAMGMAVDLMFDRGFSLRAEVDLGKYKFKITFEPPSLNNAAQQAVRSRR